MILVIWCSISLKTSVHSQGYYYKHSNVNAYHIVNGNLHYIPEQPTTTPEPSLLETLFPWKGGAYDSSKTPEEDEAILNSISDHEPAASEPVSSTADGEGYFSWFSLPTFGSTETTEAPQPDHTIQFPGGNYDNYDAASINNVHLQNNPVPSSPPYQQSMGVPPYEHQVPAHVPYPYFPSPPSNQPQHPLSQQVPNEIRQNLHPTFQFHQQMKDSIPLPTPSINGLQQQPMFPYPYASAATTDFGKGPSSETSTSFLDMLSNYFTFGKRSDFEGEQNPTNVMKSRSSEEEATLDLEQYADNFSDVATKEASSFSAEFPCPRSGIWRWNGDVCIAVGPVPVWACRPNDLIVSGKIAICRNKIYFSPKIISTSKVHNETFDLPA